ncbi:MAG: PH domain-containing protein [Bacteroidaceae bacterium]|mgnify:FL=1|nr:PH domain-containing protein [Bacteroidaceae bacterium]
MDKIYHQRFTLAAKSFITVVTLLAVYLFWFKSIAHIIVGVMVVLMLVSIIESVIHTTYKITSDDKLIIERGRLFKKRILPIGDIVKISRRETKFKLSHYILIEYGADKCVSLQPEDEDALMEEIKKHLIKIDETV